MSHEWSRSASSPGRRRATNARRPSRPGPPCSRFSGPCAAATGRTRSPRPTRTRVSHVRPRLKRPRLGEGSVGVLLDLGSGLNAQHRWEVVERLVDRSGPSGRHGLLKAARLLPSAPHPTGPRTASTTAPASSASPAASSSTGRSTVTTCWPCVRTRSASRLECHDLIAAPGMSTHDTLFFQFPAWCCAARRLRVGSAAGRSRRSAAPCERRSERALASPQGQCSQGRDWSLGCRHRAWP